jgi:hypothetical protein
VTLQQRQETPTWIWEPVASQGKQWAAGANATQGGWPGRQLGVADSHPIFTDTCLRSASTLNLIRFTQVVAWLSLSIRKI